MNSVMQETTFSNERLADALMYAMRQVKMIQDEQFIHSFSLSPSKDGWKIKYKIHTDTEVHIN